MTTYTQESRRAGILVLSLAIAACEPAPAPEASGPPSDTAVVAPAAPVRDTVLEAKLGEVAAGLDGEVGVAVLHLQRETEASLSADRAFPLASIYKLPIAYAALQGGRAGPGDTVAVVAEDRAPGPSLIESGTQVPVARLVRRSLAHSDNTASDVLLRLAGGPDEVTRRIRALGVGDVRVDRSMSGVFADWRGGGGAAAFVGDPRDTGSPAGIVALLAALHRGEGLEPAARGVLLDGLEAADTGPNRIRAGVPEGTRVAHKTGTLGPLTHDVGIIPLPAGGGDVALAVLIRSDAPLPARERLIAAVAEAVWEHFAF